MSPIPRITPRERLVLFALIQSYIASGEPVASNTLARQFAGAGASGMGAGLSSATIRNVMASLGEAGFLEQAHSSAGRIPTPLAFRLYVESLGTHTLAAAPQRPGALLPERREQIQESFAGVETSEQFLERTAQVLGSISGGVGVALMAAGQSHTLEHIHFSRLGSGRVLAVLVTEGGVVLDRVLLLDRVPEGGELEASARYLNENFRGWSVERIRTELTAHLDEDRTAYNQLRHSLEELKGALAGGGGEATVYIGGVANLVGSAVDPERLRGMLHALETRQTLVALLNAYVDARQQTVRVVVGLEDRVPEMTDFVFVGAPARLGPHATGTVAVIAPTRMQYQETIGAVGFIAHLSGRLLDRTE